MRKKIFIGVLAAALAAPAVYAADVTEADFQKAMKEIQSGVQSVNQTLRAGGDLEAAVAGAKAVDAALGSVEAFWAARKDEEAVKMNGAARAAALAVAKAAGDKDATATGEAMKSMFAACRTCHDIHREQLPDRSYKIK